jgi:hypothetical protein
MRVVRLTAYLIVPLLCPRLYGAWNALLDKDGTTVQVAVDFAIKSSRVDHGDGVTIDATAQKDGKEIGFVATLDLKWKSQKMPIFGRKNEFATVTTSGLTIKSIGDPTTNLERMLNEQLRGPKETEDTLHCTGLYNAVARGGLTSLPEISILDLLDVGLTYDSGGNQIAGDCFAITLVLDVPMERITAYFSLRAGYGGSPRFERARTNWHEGKKG